MKKFLKRLSITLLITLLTLMIAAVVIAAFFQNAVGKKLISEINKQMTTELTVGEFDLSLLRGFPNATASLRDVVVLGTSDEGLLEAKEMSFHFRLLSLFGSQVKVHSVTIRDGALNIHIDKKGGANYDIFKPSETDEESNFNISLKKARLEDIELAYRDGKLRQELLMRVEEADFSGELSSKRYDLKSNARLVSNFIDLNDLRYFAGKRWGYEANIFVDVEKGEYDFNKVIVNIEDNTFKVAGKVNKEPNYTNIDLIATADEANLESIIAILPEQQLNLLGGFSSQGKFHFSMDILGNLSPKENPAIKASFSLDNGRLTHPDLKEPFKDVSFEAEFTNGERKSIRTSSFEISNFKGYLNRELLTLHLKVDDLDDPFIDFQADGALPVGYFYEFFQHPGITDGDGEIEIRRLDLAGLYRDMMSINYIDEVEMSGEIGFDDASLKINGEKLTIDRGDLTFQNNQLELRGLKIEGAGTEVNFAGTAQNLLPVLFADSLNSQNAELLFECELSAPEIDLGKFVKMSDVPVEEYSVDPVIYDSLQVKKYVKRGQITDFLKGSLTAKVDEFRYHKIEGKDFDGRLSIENSQLQVTGKAKGMDGNYDLDATVFFEKEPRLEAKLSGQDIDVKKFFYQTENVGQDQLRAENLEGQMNTKLLVHAYWDSTGNFRHDQLHVWAGIGVKNGELKGFELLESFSDFVDVKDLRHVRFTDMQNWLEITDSKVYLPVMFIQNNAMNLSICGEQTFDDKIDYGIKVNAGQVIANKFKSGPNQKPIKAKKNGFFNLYYNIYGTLDNYQYETNKRKVKDMFDRSERQKRRIRAELIKAFGAPLNMLREPADWGDEGEVAKWKEDDDVEYIEGF